MKNITIPVAIQIGIDDVAWDLGNDMRLTGGQSRTGIPRYHTMEDYEALYGDPDITPFTDAFSCLE